ncbi:hypothetical protein SEA_MOLLYMUR_70 [Gordonia phage Mollymur]|uniref:Uncharacterized protein n=1 Tax=Gordonia phage Mollymur TaxID=2590895 RepID=A0A4Y6EBT6_9CAUD|nr:hypothetical protein PQB84_gp056 [Gordonia phage Mollymur]QDF15430.1 hypothetical protein SEA_MOLLYMUR_70 [Gordonia phage Mollymur]
MTRGPLAPGEWKSKSPEEIDDLVREWHTSPRAEYCPNLNEWLGMSFTEYGEWLIG